MARSLTVKHEEEARTTPLFTVFIVIALGWMLLGALFGAPSADAVQAQPDVPALNG